MRSSGSDPNVRHPDRIDLRETRPRRSLLLKNFFTLFIAVVVPLILGGVSEAWFGYRAQRLLLNGLLQGEARSAADRIAAFYALNARMRSWSRTGMQCCDTGASGFQKSFEQNKIIPKLP
jgi:hypothetical protein